MELVKLHESYHLTKEFENGWVVNGTVNIEEKGSVSMWCSITKNEESIGNLNYSKPVEGNVNVNYDVAENLRDEFTSYTDLLIDELLVKLAE